MVCSKKQSLLGIINKPEVQDMPTTQTEFEAGTVPIPSKMLDYDDSGPEESLGPTRAGQG